MDTSKTNPNDFPPIKTVDVTAHLPGQYTNGPLRYVVFKDDKGALGALWRATAPNDEAVGWQPNPKHPAAGTHRSTWRIRITEAQGRAFALDFNPDTEQPYTAESFFRHWTETASHEPLELDGPHDFAGASTDLESHLGWS